VTPLPLAEPTLAALLHGCGARRATVARGARLGGGGVVALVVSGEAEVRRAGARPAGGGGGVRVGAGACVGGDALVARLDDDERAAAGGAAGAPAPSAVDESVVTAVFECEVFRWELEPLVAFLREQADARSCFVALAATESLQELS